MSNALKIAETLEDYAELDAAEHVEPVVIQLELDAAKELRRLDELVKKYEQALECISGKGLWFDDLMSNSEIAEYALRVYR